MKKFGIFLGLFFVLTLRIYSDRLVIQSGHQDAIRSMVLSDKVILSAGDDGRVKVWSLENRTLEYDIQVSHLPIIKIAVHPTRSVFAALIKESLTLSRFVFYNWETGKLLHSLAMEELPLHFSFSSGGAYFLYSKVDQKSIVVINPDNWRPLSYLKEGFGIVSYFVVGGKDDKVLMAYQPSGKIYYKDITTGKDLISRPFMSLRNLEAVSVSSNSRFLAAATADSLVIIGLLSGKNEASIPLKGISQTLIHPEGTTVYALVKEGDRNVLQIYGFDGKELKLKEVPELKKIKDNMTTLLVGGKNLYYSNIRGQMKYLSPEMQDFLFSENKLLAMSGIAQSGGQIAMVNSLYALSFPISTLEVDKVKTFNYELFPVILKGPLGVEFFKPNKLLVWTRDLLDRGFYIMDMKSKEIIHESDGFATPLRQLDVFSRYILTVEESGDIQLLNKRSFEQEYKYKDQRLNKAVILNEDFLMLARGKATQLGSALVRVNHKTGETVPVNSTSLLCYDLLYDEKRDRLFTLSVKYEYGNSESTLKLHFNRGYEKETVLYSYKGEDLSASFAIDKNYVNLYTSLGFKEIMHFDGYRVKTFAPTEHISRKLYVVEDYLLSMNIDSSITVWNRLKKNKIMDLYFINTPELNWIALLPDGRSFSSKMGENFLRKYKEK